MLRYRQRVGVDGIVDVRFNGHPPLGVNATEQELSVLIDLFNSCFNGHPPLGVNATMDQNPNRGSCREKQFQWAPTLGGECYPADTPPKGAKIATGFNGHPPLGVNATLIHDYILAGTVFVSMGTHPWG